MSVREITGTRRGSRTCATHRHPRARVVASCQVSGTVHRVLLVGPDDDDRRSLHVLLDRAGKHVAAVTEAAAVARFLAAEPCDAVIADATNAAALVAAVRAADASRPPVLAVVRERDIARSLALLEAGVDDIVAEPLDELALALAFRHLPLRSRGTASTSARGTASLIGGGEAMTELRQMIERIASHRATVLVLGESGTGKELVARAIHDVSPRRDRRFVAINCAAIPPALLESELFGHARGSFTDAVRDKPGLFEQADGGTLFLDEVGEIPLPLQSKLLRALQEHEIRRIGDTDSIKVDVRVVAATLRDLTAEVEAGRFREDLFYRLNVVAITIAPLRDRREDVPELVRFFAARHAQRHGKDGITIEDDAIEALSRMPWPGNVRELENMIERAIVLADGPAIDLKFLSTVMDVRGAAPPSDIDETDHELSIKKATRQLEAELIKRALQVTQGNRTNAAKLLELSHRALLYKMKDYGIS